MTWTIATKILLPVTLALGSISCQHRQSELSQANQAQTTGESDMPCQGLDQLFLGLERIPTDLASLVK